MASKRRATSVDSNFDLLQRYLGQIAGIAAMAQRGLNEDQYACNVVWAIEDLAEEALFAANRYRDGLEAGAQS